MKSIHIEHGDLCEGNVDLTVIPCSGKMKDIETQRIQARIDAFGLSSPATMRHSFGYGRVSGIMRPIRGAAISKYFVYAASVLNSSDRDSIASIGRQLGELTYTNPDIRIVEAPFLGCGSGGLSPEVAIPALAAGFLATRHPAAILQLKNDNAAAITSAQRGVEELLGTDAETIGDDSMKTKSVGRFQAIRLAVIVALAEERKIFTTYFPGKIVERFHIDDLTIDILEREGTADRIGLATVNRMGNVAAGVAASKILEVFDLDYLVNLGLAAGAQHQKQSLGDIIVADRIRYYEAGKVGPDTFQMAPEYSDLRSSIMHALQNANYEQWPLGSSVGGKTRQVHFGTVASGEKVISRQSFTDELLKADRTIVGVEMESYGISTAVFGRKEKFVLIRGISDFADESKHDDARLSAMEGAVRFFDQALRHGVFKGRSVQEANVTAGSKKDLVVTLQDTVVRDGVANNYVQISSVASTFARRGTVIRKLYEKRTLGDLRVFCIQLNIDFDEIQGETKSEKAAGILEYVERKKIMTIDDLEALLEDA